MSLQLDLVLTLKKTVTAVYWPNTFLADANRILNKNKSQNDVSLSLYSLGMYCLRVKHAKLNRHSLPLSPGEHLVQILHSEEGQILGQNRLIRVVRSQGLNVFRDGDSTALLDNTFHCLTTVTDTNFLTICLEFSLLQPLPIASCLFVFNLPEESGSTFCVTSH